MMESGADAYLRLIQIGRPVLLSTSPASRVTVNGPALVGKSLIMIIEMSAALTNTDVGVQIPVVAEQVVLNGNACPVTRASLKNFLISSLSL
jgi:hypothetical protein